MKLVNVYPIFSDDFLSFGLEKYHTDNAHASEFFESTKFNYPYALKAIYKKVLSREIFIPSLPSKLQWRYFSDGMMAISSEQSFSRFDGGIERLIQIADEEREAIKKWIESKEIDTLVGAASNHGRTDTKKQRAFKLGFAYSHNFFSSSKEIDVREFIPSDKWLSTSNEFVIRATSEPAVNSFVVTAALEKELFEYINNFTILAASLYEIKEACVVKSRLLIERGFGNENLPAVLSETEKQVGFFDQHLAELKLVDFLSDPFEETLGKTTAISWDWGGLLSGTVELCQHLKDQVKKLDDELSRSSEIRANKILFAFTFLTVLDVSGSLISLYDMSNSIVPVIRIVTVISFLIFAVIVVNIYLRKTR